MGSTPLEEEITKKVYEKRLAELKAKWGGDGMGETKEERKIFYTKGFEFNLSKDISYVKISKENGLSEASIFYSARILEVTVSELINYYQLKDKKNLFQNLYILGSYNLLPQSVQHIANSLRILGNQVRHVHFESSLLDQESCILFLEFWLNWYSRQNKSIEVTDNIFQHDRELYVFLEIIVSSYSDRNVTLFQKQNSLNTLDKVFQFGSIISLLVERYLDLNLLSDASYCINEGLKFNPDYFKLRLMEGLYYKRMGNLDLAIEKLEFLYNSGYGNEEEVRGILAGIYKSIWLENGDEKWLRKSQKKYESGWKEFPENVYLGINLATTSLFLNKFDLARSTAEDIKILLYKRKDFLKSISETNILSLWDELTLAESELIIGNIAECKRIFTSIALNNEKSEGSLKVAAKQFSLIIKQMNLINVGLNFLEKYL
jgi:hypothetical protein